LPAGSRTIVSFGSANRDERKWDNPETFDILRNRSAEHLGFGEHPCVGSNLARLEIRALLTARARRVERFELVEMKRGVNNVLRSIERCVVTAH
jgi:cytochrome P450